MTAKAATNPIAIAIMISYEVFILHHSYYDVKSLNFGNTHISIELGGETTTIPK